VAAFDDLLRQAFVACALLALPVLGAATVAGTAIAILQAATQIQEQTLSLLPKLLAVAMLVALGGAFGLRVLGELFVAAAAAMPALVRG
jgi:flagellar biosynthesis protein FliQ